MAGFVDPCEQRSVGICDTFLFANECLDMFGRERGNIRVVEFFLFFGDYRRHPIQYHHGSHGNIDHYEEYRPSQKDR